jgi:Tat protein translocase TatB subunit
VFNLSGSELIFILLLALVVLGPEKLPDAIRKFGRVYGEVRKMSSGFQTELRQAMDEPMRELRETAELTRRAATFDPDTPRPEPKPTPEPTASPEPTATSPELTGEPDAGAAPEDTTS